MLGSTPKCDRVSRHRSPIASRPHGTGSHPRRRRAPARRISPPAEEIRRLFAAMVTARAFDHKASALQLQGRLATYAQFEGQGSRTNRPVLRRCGRMTGWLRPTAMPPRCGCRGSRGRTCSWVGWGRAWRLAAAGCERAAPSITVGAHMIHAVGLGWAERLRGSDRVAITYFGDGATLGGGLSRGDELYGVYRTPTVFLCQNNGWAISMSRERQTASGDHRPEGGRLWHPRRARRRQRRARSLCGHSRCGRSGSPGVKGRRLLKPKPSGWVRTRPLTTPVGIATRRPLRVEAA